MESYHNYPILLLTRLSFPVFGTEWSLTGITPESRLTRADSLRTISLTIALIWTLARGVANIETA